MTLFLPSAMQTDERSILIPPHFVWDNPTIGISNGTPRGLQPVVQLEISIWEARQGLETTRQWGSGANRKFQTS